MSRGSEIEEKSFSLPFSHIGTVISLQKLFRIDGPLVRGLTLITNLILLNTLFIITSIPLVTMGASVTSLNTMLHRILKGDDGDIIYHYFRIFKSNFKQATVIWAALVLLGVLLFLNYSIFSNTNFLNGYGLLLLAPVGMLVILGVAILLPYIGLFENSLKASVINSIFVCILDPLRAILLILFNCAVVYMSVNTPERLLTAIYVFTCGGFAIWALLNVKVTSKMFKKAYKLSNGGKQDENF